MKNVKILILGASSVGKTSLVHQVVFGSQHLSASAFNNPSPTIEDVYFATIDQSDKLSSNISNSGNSNISNNNTACNNSSNFKQDDRILFFDVAGVKQNIDIELLRNYITFADEFILVYAINDRSSFNLVDTIKKLIDQTKGKRDRPIIVLGNKVDLDSRRQVSFDDSLIWAKRENVKVFEVTSLVRDTLLDFTRFLATQLTTSQNHSSSTFKLKRSKTYQSSG